MSDRTLTISLSSGTVQALQQSGFRLYVFRVVASSNKSGAPLVWARVDSYIESIVLGFSSTAFAAYVSTDAIAVDAPIVMGATAPAGRRPSRQCRGRRRTDSGKRGADRGRLHRERGERVLYLRACRRGRWNVHAAVLRLYTLSAGGRDHAAGRCNLRHVGDIGVRSVRLHAAEPGAGSLRNVWRRGRTRGVLRHCRGLAPGRRRMGRAR